MGSRCTAGDIIDTEEEFGSLYPRIGGASVEASLISARRDGSSRQESSRESLLRPLRHFRLTKSGLPARDAGRGHRSALGTNHAGSQGQAWKDEPVDVAGGLVKHLYALGIQKFFPGLPDGLSLDGINAWRAENDPSHYRYVEPDRREAVETLRGELQKKEDERLAKEKAAKEAAEAEEARLAALPWWQAEGEFPGKCWLGGGQPAEGDEIYMGKGYLGSCCGLCRGACHQAKVLKQKGKKPYAAGVTLCWPAAVLADVFNAGIGCSILCCGFCGGLTKCCGRSDETAHTSAVPLLTRRSRRTSVRAAFTRFCFVSAIASTIFLTSLAKARSE